MFISLRGMSSLPSQMRSQLIVIMKIIIVIIIIIILLLLSLSLTLVLLTGLISWTCLSAYWSACQPVMMSESTCIIEQTNYVKCCSGFGTLETLSWTFIHDLSLLQHALVKHVLHVLHLTSLTTFANKKVQDNNYC